MLTPVELADALVSNSAKESSLEGIRLLDSASLACQSACLSKNF